MTATALEFDLELLVGEMEAPHCESPHHLTQDDHDDGPATHYMLIGHACFGPVDQVIPVCYAYVRHWHMAAKLWGATCSWCGLNLQEGELNQVLGPINS